MPGATEAGDDLIEDQQDVVSVADRADPLQVAGRWHADTRREHDGLRNECGDGLGPFEDDCLFQHCGRRRRERLGLEAETRLVRERWVHVNEARRKRLVDRPPAWRARRREGVAGATVIPAVVRQNLELLAVAVLRRELARHLDGCLVSLGAA